MNGQRRVPAVLGLSLVLLAGTFTAAPAGAQVGSKSQDTPTTIWQQPGPAVDLVEGVGTWVYVAPHGPTTGQLPVGGYKYVLSFSFPGLHLGFVGLSTGPAGNVAQFSMTTPTNGSVEVPYNWSPGRFYFLYAHHLQNGVFGAWVMDWQAGTWAYIGSIQAPPAWGLPTKSSRTMLIWPGAAGVASDCTGFPRTDAYFFSPLGYTGQGYTVATFDFHYVTPGDCAAQTEILANGWVHYRLGTLPAG